MVIPPIHSSTLYFFFILALVVFSTAILAQDSAAIAPPPDDLYEMEIVITAVKPHTITPVSVTVINRKDIEASPARNIDDLMVGTKGVVLKRSVGMGEGIPADIEIRGIPASIAASRVLILIDGIPTNVSGTPLLILNEIPLEAVERVEIVRGPYSCIYGANAFGGAINIVTRTPVGRQQIEVSGELGNMVYWQGAFYAGGGDSAFTWSGSGGVRSIANYIGRDSALVRRNSGDVYLPVDNNGYADRRFFLKTGYTLTPRLSAGLNVRYFESSLGFGKTRNTTQPEDVITAGQKFMAAPSLTWRPGEGIDVTASGFYRRTRGDFYGESILAFNGAQALWTETEWQAVSEDFQGHCRTVVQAGEANRVTFGFEGLLNRTDFGATKDRQSGEIVVNSREVKKTFTGAGVYVQDELSAFNRLTVVPGIRCDYQYNFSWAISPKISSSFKVSERLSLRTSLGRGFRAPSTSELYLPDLTVNAATTLVANPDLKPEYVWAADGGVVVQLLDDRIVLENDVFYNRMDDLVVAKLFSDLGNNVVKVTFRNTARAVSYGWESDALVRLWGPVRFFANYTNTQSIDNETGYGLDYIPIDKASAGLRFNVSWDHYTLEGSLSEGYIGERTYLDWGKWDVIINHLEESQPVRYYLSSYWRTDGAVKVTCKDRFWAGFSAQNILNAVFEESGGNIAPGRLVCISAGASF
ncbi:MAG: hypothetical protein A2268_00190 [Candidatus Raymondbacteria bacterium RifOxyA12_full_50_37]|nr:MAG: hypothetical protein A2268_00190 [Candidatus Raymondbacteria bacterium RifOxyA12_full_50_37]OGJ92737.1 MAG: hypothetical protein A2248_04240 [Candidatus Raymondbacteria bacterium RIFOXYA2_FULL_49_16]OGP44513.1 MAG: hypothetical protein A2324_10035 [Candidatus Raymondbacteria bacterium RIFOXYB2_FULL_49_35]